MAKSVAAFAGGVIVTLALIALAAYVAVTQGMIPANADSRAPRIERWAANTSLHAVFRKLPPRKNPVAATPKNLIAGIHLYEGDCAVCHGDSSGKPTAIAAGLYIRAPQLAKDGVEDDPDQVTYWKIAHGYRWTGMPSFGKSLTQTQMWQLTAFLKTMDHLPPQAERVWRAVRVKGTMAPPMPERAMR